MGRRAAGILAGILAGIGLLLAPWPAPVGGRGGVARAAENGEKPKLELLAEPAVGFPPVAATLSARLKGVDRDDPNFCHPAVTWIHIGPNQSRDNASKVREDPACLHSEEEVVVTLSYTKTFNLYRPGTHLFRLMIEGHDHTEVVSGYAKVEVLRSR